MPFVAILSTIDTVLLSAVLAPSTSLASSDARMALSAVRRRRAHLPVVLAALDVLPVRLQGGLGTLGHVLSSLWILGRDNQPRSTNAADCNTRPKACRAIQQKPRQFAVPVETRYLAPRDRGLLRLGDVHRNPPLAVPLAHPDARVEPFLARRPAARPGRCRCPTCSRDRPTGPPRRSGLSAPAYAAAWPATQDRAVADQRQHVRGGGSGRRAPGARDRRGLAGPQRRVQHAVGGAERRRAVVVVAGESVRVRRAGEARSEGGRPSASACRRPCTTLYVPFRCCFQTRSRSSGAAVRCCGTAGCSRPGPVR